MGTSVRVLPKNGGVLNNFLMPGLILGSGEYRGCG